MSYSNNVIIENIKTKKRTENKPKLKHKWGRPKKWN